MLAPPLLAERPAKQEKAEVYREPLFLKPPSSVYRKELTQWRQEMEMLGTDSNGALDLKSTILPLTNRWTTDICAHPDDTLLLVTSATRSKNVLLARYNPKTGSNSSCKPNSTKDEPFSIAGSFTNAYPIFAVDWNANHALFGCAQNYVQLCSVDSGNGKISPAEQFPHPMKQADTFASPPGRYPNSNRVEHVQFEPIAQNPTNFIALESCNLRVWNLNSPKSPFASCKISQEQVTSGDWSLLSPHLVAICSADTPIIVVDLRCMGYSYTPAFADTIERVDHPIAWFNPFAHSSSISSVKWSAFVPYWLASSSGDHTVKVWDLRQMKSPSCIIDDHNDAVNSIAWSNTHGHMISTGCADGVWKLWDIQSEKFYQQEKLSVVGATAVASFGESSLPSNSIVKTIASPIWANTYFALSSVGELQSVTLGKDHLHKISPHRFSSKLNPDHYELEKHVYERDMKTAYDLVLAFNSKLKDDDPIEEVAQMIELCSEMNQIPEVKLDSYINDTLVSVELYAGIVSGSLYSSTQDPVDLISNISYSIKYGGNRNESDLPNTLSCKLSPVNGVRPVNLDQRIYESRSRTMLKMSMDERMTDFMEKITQFSYFIPPAFKFGKLLSPVPLDIQKKYGRLCLNIKTKALLDDLRLGTLIDEKSSSGEIYVEKLFRLFPDILKSLEEDPRLFSSQHLFQILRWSIPHDYLRSLDFGRRIVEIFEKEDGKTVNDYEVHFNTISSLLHLLMYPTVFDQLDVMRGSQTPQPPPEMKIITKVEKGSRMQEITQEDLPEPLLPDFETLEFKRENSLENILQNAKFVSPMIKLEYRVQKTLFKYSRKQSSGSYVQNVSEAVLEEIGAQRTVSVATNNAHLNALLLLARFDEYFNLAFDLILEHSQYKYPFYVAKHVETVGMYRLMRQKDKMGHYLDPLKSEWHKKEISLVIQFISTLKNILVIISKKQTPQNLKVNFSNKADASTHITTPLSPNFSKSPKTGQNLFAQALETTKSKIVLHLTTLFKAFEVWMESAFQVCSSKEDSNKSFVSTQGEVRSQVTLLVETLRSGDVSLFKLSEIEAFTQKLLTWIRSN